MEVVVAVIVISTLATIPKGLIKWGYPRGVMFKALNGGIVVSEFVLQSGYYVHFLAKYP